MNHPMYSVTVYADSISEYVSQIYAGLYELSAARLIDLQLSKKTTTRKCCVDFSPFTLFMDVKDEASNKCRSIFFDMVDGHRTLSVDQLNDVDVYIKRTYDEPFISNLKSDLRKKILPYGLHYSCRSKFESPRKLVRRMYLHHCIHKTFRIKPVKALKQTLGRPLKMFIQGNVLRTSVSRQPMLIGEFEVPPTMPTERKIYFRTRVYDVNQAQSAHSLSQMRKVNRTRVDIIRALASHYGDSFVGGLRRSQFAQKHYPDCIDLKIINHARHIESGKRYLININTDGLHGSVGWKFPEYMAASRCIVSEPVRVRLPVAVEDGKHYFGFNSPNECINACEKLMKNNQLAKAMRQHNYDYYRKYLKPLELIYNCIQTAFSS